MKKTISFLLAAMLLITGFILPVFTAGPSAAESWPDSEETYSAEEEAAPADETPAGETEKAPWTFRSGYVSVASGTPAFYDRALTAQAGFFTSSGNIFAQTVSDGVLQVSFCRNNESEVTTLFISTDLASPLPAGAVNAMVRSANWSNRPTYNGYPILSISFAASTAPAASEAEEDADETEDDEAAEPEDAGEEPEEIPDETEQAMEEPDVIPDETEQTAEETEEITDEPEQAAEETDETPEAEEAAVPDWAAAPTGLTASLTEDQKAAVLTWTGNGAAEQYAVYEQVDGYEVFTDIVSGAETYTTAALEEGEHTFFVIPQHAMELGIPSEPALIVIPEYWKQPASGLTAALSEDGSQVILSWAGNGYAPSYRVYEKLGDENKSLGNATNAETFTTKALEPGEHTFYVQPRKDKVNGTPSETVTITVPMHWKAAPADLTAALSDDNSQVILSWAGNGIAEAYRVYEKLEDGNKSLGVTDGADTFTTKTLEPGEHTFFVTPRQNKTNGLYSETVTITVPMHWKVAPADLTAVLSEDNSQVILSWAGNGVAEAYRVYEKLEDENKSLGSVADAETFTTKTLDPGEHTFYVQPRLNKAYGDKSETVTITVPMHWKVAPTNLTAELSEDGSQVILSWAGNGVAEAYRVYEKLEDENKSLGVAEGADTFTTKALEPGEHTFFVVPRQNKVNGLYSETVTITVPMHWKAAPTDLTAELAEDDASVILGWTGNGLAETYRVYEKLEDSNQYLGTVTGAETFVTEPLEPGEHTFFVFARQNKVNGIYSETISVLVPEK